MKILISTLLLTILIFLHSGEINAVDNEGSSLGFESVRERTHPYRGRGRGGARPGSGRKEGSGRGVFRVTDTHHRQLVVEGPSSGFLTHMKQDIEVWISENGTRILQANYPGHACPTGRDYATKNFLVRLATLSGTLNIVEYVNKDGTLMCVRAPKQTKANVMEPNNEQWFIVYLSKYFRVRTNRETNMALGISIASEIEHEVVPGRKAEEVNMAGFKFLVYRWPNGKISGAELLKRPASPIVVHHFRDLFSLE